MLPVQTPLSTKTSVRNYTGTLHSNLATYCTGALLLSIGRNHTTKAHIIGYCNGTQHSTAQGGKSKCMVGQLPFCNMEEVKGRLDGKKAVNENQ